MKKMICLLLALMAVLSLSVPVAAASESVYIIDQAQILSKSEWDPLEEQAEDLAEKYGCGIYVVILEDHSNYGYSVEDACRNIVDRYGLGDETDGNSIVMVLSMDERRYYIEDFGRQGMYALTDYGRESLEEAMKDDFADDDWYAGLSDYLDQAEVILEAAEKGEPYDENSEPTPLFQRALMGYGIALFVGLLIALVVCSIYTAQMKTAVRATSASAYVAPSGVKMIVRQDRYTHTTQTRRKIETKSSSGSGSSRSGGKSGGGGTF